MDEKIIGEIKSLLRDMVRVYHQRQTERTISNRICRGRIVPVSGEFENRFARFLESVLSPQFTFLVDYPLTGGIRYPDVAVLCDGFLHTVFDLKIDLGRSGIGWNDASEKQFKELAHAGLVTYKGLGGERCQATVARDVCRAVVLLTGKNDRTGRLANLEDRFNRCFVLSRHAHPNDRRCIAHHEELTMAIIDDPGHAVDWMHLAAFLSERFHE